MLWFKAGCASLLRVGALAFGRCGKAGVDCVNGTVSSTCVALGVDVAALIRSEVADCVVVARLEDESFFVY